MNTNLIHNVLNLIGLIVGVLITYDWSSIITDPVVAAKVAGAFIIADKLIKIAMNLMRDGLTGLFLPQPPVERR